MQAVVEDHVPTLLSLFTALWLGVWEIQKMGLRISGYYALLNDTIGVQESTSLESTSRDDEAKPISESHPLISVGGSTHKGQVRDENQDAYAVGRLSPETGIMVVCDGVGGHPGGAEAAQTAVRYLMTYISVQDKKHEDHLVLLNQALEDLQHAFAMASVEGMTTVIVALCHRNKLYYATLGDGELIVLFPDQMYQRLVVPHHAFDAPSNIITAYVSGTEVFTPRLGLLHLPDHSMVLSMSDGLSDLFPVENIQEHLQTYRNFALSKSVDSLCEHLINSIEFSRDEVSGAWLHSDNMTLAMMLLGEVNHG